jgi:hypothetical protein
VGTLVLIVVSFVFAATTPDGRWSRGVFLLLAAATLLVAGWTSRAGPVRVRSTLALVVVAVGLATAEIVDGGRTLEGAATIVSAALVVGTMAWGAKNPIG